MSIMTTPPGGHTGSEPYTNHHGRIPADSDPRIGEIHAYWRSIGPSGLLPGRQHLDPIDIPHLLTNLWLIDIVGRPPRFRTRLMGCALCDYFGGDLTGTWIDEEFDNFETSATCHGLKRTVTSAEPDYRRGPPTLNVPKAFLEIERVLLPFATDGTSIDMVLCHMLMRSGTDSC